MRMSSSSQPRASISSRVVGKNAGEIACSRSFLRGSKLHQRPLHEDGSLTHNVARRQTARAPGSPGPENFIWSTWVPLKILLPALWRPGGSKSFVQTLCKVAEG